MNVVYSCYNQHQLLSMNTRVPEWRIEINHCTAQFFDIIRDLFMTNELHIAKNRNESRRDSV